MPPPLVPSAAPSVPKLPQSESSERHDAQVVQSISDEVLGTVRATMRTEGQAAQEATEDDLRREYLQLGKELSALKGQGRRALSTVQQKVWTLKVRMNAAKKLALADLPEHVKDFVGMKNYPIRADDGSWTVVLMGPSPKLGLYRVEVK